MQWCCTVGVALNIDVNTEFQQGINGIESVPFQTEREPRSMEREQRNERPTKHSATVWGPRYPVDWGCLCLRLWSTVGWTSSDRIERRSEVNVGQMDQVRIVIVELVRSDDPLSPGGGSWSFDSRNSSERYGVEWNLIYSFGREDRIDGRPSSRVWSMDGIDWSVSSRDVRLCCHLDRSDSDQHLEETFLPGLT